MLTGSIWYSGGWLCIKVHGLPSMRFLWYSKREAIRKYREAHGLKYKKIEWLE